MSAIAELAAVLMLGGCSAELVRQSVDLAEQHASEVLERTAIIGKKSAELGGLSADVVRSSSDLRRKPFMPPVVQVTLG